MLHFIRFYTACNGKKIFRQKNTLFLNYNLASLDICNGLLKVYRINPEGRIHNYTKGLNELNGFHLLVIAAHHIADSS